MFRVTTHMKPALVTGKNIHFLHPNSHHVWQSWQEADAKWRLMGGSISTDGMTHGSSSALRPGR